VRWTIREWATDAAAIVHRCTATCADHESRPTVADRWHIAVTTPGGRLSWLMHFDTRLGVRRLTHGRVHWTPHPKGKGASQAGFGGARARGAHTSDEPSVHTAHSRRSGRGSDRRTEVWASVVSPKPPRASASFREGQRPHASASADSESSLVARSSAPAFFAAQTNTQATTATVRR
jgi:hypothetical protein